MSEHTPQHHHDPVHPVDLYQVGPTLIGLVAGDPSVPGTVWRSSGTPADGRCAACPPVRASVRTRMLAFVRVLPRGPHRRLRPALSCPLGRR
jgi:hypothetical protein